MPPHRRRRRFRQVLLIAVWALGVAAVVSVVVFAFSDTGPSSTPSDPELIAAGAEVFAANCAACHGANIEGTDSGPSLLDPIYAPNHHADAAFFRAVRQGVVPHHWNFGPMPPRPGLSNEDIEAVVAFVRSKQAEAGVTFDPRHG